ncbi:MAG TPA: response regulator [Methylomirabilota bacterium]|nr:response regulator [Methylomirabilota bacterium]
MCDAAPLSRKTLMVVEDDSEMRAMLSELLFQSGYSVFSSDNAQSACDLARMLRPVAILCDVVMPTMSGFEAAERLRQDPQTSSIPVILMTGHRLQYDHSLYLRWLHKPFTSEQLTSAIALTVN